MLKMLMHDEERTGSELLAWWDGHGAVRVLDLWRRPPARANDGTRSLATMARETTNRRPGSFAKPQHSPRSTTRAPPASLTPLQFWFAPLKPGADRLGGILTLATSLRTGFRAQRDIAMLHGDLHHDNVLDGEHRGWRAIDPGTIGERTFDLSIPA